MIVSVRLACEYNNVFCRNHVHDPYYDVLVVDGCTSHDNAGVTKIMLALGVRNAVCNLQY